jgi:hypothetical protein
MTVVTVATHASEAAGTLRLVLAELTRMRASGPTAAELAAARATLAGVFPAGFETTSGLAAALVTAELHGLPDGWIGNLPVALAQVTPAEAKAAAERHVDAENLAVVIAGKAAEIAPQLDAAGLRYERLGWQEAAGKRDRQAAAAAAPDPKKTAAGKALLDAALTASGGAERLKGLKSLRAVGKVKLRLGPQQLEGGWTRTLVPPGRLRLDVDVSGGQKLVMVIAGDAAWQQVGGESVRLPEDKAREARGGLWREPTLVLLRHLDPTTVVQATGREQVSGQSYDVVYLRSADGESEAKLYLDVKSHRLARLAYPIGGGVGLEEYGDYRQVNGLWLPFHQRAGGSGQVYEVTLTQVTVDGALDDTDFKPPSP